MQPVNISSILAAVIVLLVVVCLYQCYGWRLTRVSSCQDNFTPGADPSPGRIAAMHHLTAIRGQPGPGYRQTPIWEKPGGLKRLAGSSAHVTPADLEKQIAFDAIAKAERSMWTSIQDSTGTHDVELGADAASDTMQYHTSQPAMDHNSYITSLVADQRTLDNQAKWAKEVTPFSKSLWNVDDMDEAQEASTHFVGLRRPQAIPQGDNMWQVTENDTATLAGNKRFVFNG